jgi:hypothetical protein
MKIGDTVQVTGVVRDIVGGSVLVVMDDNREYWFLESHVAVTQEAPTAAPVNVDVPFVAGTGTVGSMLTCTMGNWTGEPTSYAYLWLSDGVDELGSGAEYTVQASDEGHSITCIVTATNAGGSTNAPPSNAVAVAVPVK